MDDQLASIRNDLANLVSRLDDLVYDSLRRQLHGEDAKATEKRLSRARNALRRAEALLVPTGERDEELDEF